MAALDTIEPFDTNWIMGNQLARKNNQEDRDNALNITAGGLAAGGDMEGARNALWQGGNLPGGAVVQKWMDANEQADNRSTAGGMSPEAGFNYLRGKGQYEDANLQRQWARTASDDDLAKNNRKLALIYNMTMEAKTPQDGQRALDTADQYLGDPKATAEYRAIIAQNGGIEQAWPQVRNLIASEVGQAGAIHKQEQDARQALNTRRANIARLTPDEEWTPEFHKKLEAAGIPMPQQFVGPEGRKVALSLDPEIAAKAADENSKEYLAGLKKKVDPADAIPEIPSSLTGEDVLKAVPVNIANQVKALAEGRQQFPGAFALKSPYWQKMLQIVSQYDPEFNTQDYNIKHQTRLDFAKGKSAQNVTAFNTAIAHAGTLMEKAEALKNFDSVPMINAPINAVSRNVSADYQAREKSFNDQALLTATEIMKAIKGGTPTQHEIEEMKSGLSPSLSPKALREVIRTKLEALKGRIDALGDQYNRGMNTSKNGIDLLSEKSRQTLAKIHGDGAALTPTATPKTREEVEKLAPDTVFTWIDGTTHVRH